MSRKKSSNGLNQAEEEELRQKRKAKRSRFAWLARFLSFRGGRSQPDKASEPKNDKLPYFGFPLSEVYSNPALLNDNVPKPLYYTAEALKDYVSIEGLFRVSGIFSEMNRMKETFEQGQTPDFSTVDSRHSVAGLLELWFRELPEPITTHALYDEFMQCVGDDIAEEQGVANIDSILKRLPEENRIVLSFFLRFMNVVARHEDDNKMGAKNLGVVFGSILIGSAVLCFSLGLKNTLQRQNLIIQLMIENVDRLFTDHTFEAFFGPPGAGKQEQSEEEETETETESENSEEAEED